MRAALRRLAARIVARLAGLPDPSNPLAVARFAYEASQEPPQCTQPGPGAPVCVQPDCPVHRPKEGR